jgi:hypothetical protein
MKCLMYNMYKASVSPGSVQQIMSYYWTTDVTNHMGYKHLRPG